MIDVVSVSVGLDHIYNCTRKKIARTGESCVTRLEITLADELCSCWAYLDFEKANGETFKTPLIEIADNKITYDIPLGVLDVYGELKVQVVLQKESGEIWKSEPKKYFVCKSIDATDDILDKKDFVAEVQEVVDEVKAKNYANAIKGKASGTSAIRLDDVSPLEHEIKTKVLGVGEYVCSCSNSSQAEFKSDTGFYEISAIKLPVYVDYGDEESPDWQLEEMGELHFTDGSFYVDEAEEIASLEQWNTFSVGEKMYFSGWDDEANLYHSISNGLSVTRYGKNLWDNANSYFSSSTAITRTETGFSFDRSKTTASQYVTKNIPMKKGVTYIFSADTTPDTNINAMLYIYADKVYGKLLKSIASTYKRVVYTADADYPEARFTYLIGATAPSITAENMMVYVSNGNVNYDYEPYKEPATFTADENGNVAVTSLAPTTTIVADSGVSMSAEYNKDINKVLEEITQAIITLGGTV
jgi:hypothetical protein